jgi:hypothetical protein
MIEVGQLYQTYGGWNAIVIWENRKTENEGVSYIVVHKPGLDGETFALCDENGFSRSILSINEPPSYDAHHPADLMMES